MASARIHRFLVFNDDGEVRAFGNLEAAARWLSALDELGSVYQVFDVEGQAYDLFHPDPEDRDVDLRAAGLQRAALLNAMKRANGPAHLADPFEYAAAVTVQQSVERRVVRIGGLADEFNRLKHQERRVAIEVVGRGEVRDARLESSLLALLQVSPDGLPSAVPRSLIRRPQDWTITFRNCIFDSLATEVDLGFARFIECSFRNIKMSAHQGVLFHAHFVACTVSGLFDANFSGSPDSRDPFKRVAFTGNDFTGLGPGAQFFDIADPPLFSPENHLVLTNGDVTPRVRALAQADFRLQFGLEQLIHQTWYVWHRSELMEETWTALVRDR